MHNIETAENAVLNAIHDALDVHGTIQTRAEGRLQTWHVPPMTMVLLWADSRLDASTDNSLRQSVRDHLALQLSSRTSLDVTQTRDLTPSAFIGRISSMHAITESDVQSLPAACAPLLQETAAAGSVALAIVGGHRDAQVALGALVALAVIGVGWAALGSGQRGEDVRAPVSPQAQEHEPAAKRPSARRSVSSGREASPGSAAKHTRSRTKRQAERKKGAAKAGAQDGAEFATTAEADAEGAAAAQVSEGSK